MVISEVVKWLRNIASFLELILAITRLCRASIILAVIAIARGICLKISTVVR